MRDPWTAESTSKRHDTSGVSAASVLRAADAGVDIADAALSSMSG